MKAELLYFGFEAAVERAKHLGRFAHVRDAVEVAASYVSLDNSYAGQIFQAGYVGVDTRRILIWPGAVGWVCVNEVHEGKLELLIHNDYRASLANVMLEEREYTRFFMRLMASGLPMVNVIHYLDASKSDRTIIEMEMRPLMDELKSVFEIIEEQLDRESVGDPSARRRVDQELAGAVATFYNEQPLEVQLRIWNGLSELIEQDRRFNTLTRLPEYNTFKASVTTPDDVKEGLAWIIDFAYANSILIPMWDAVVAVKGAEYIPPADASIKTIGVLSQLGKLSRDDPEFTLKVVGIMSTLQEDTRFDHFLEGNPGVSLWQNMYSRVTRYQGVEAANARLAWAWYQLVLQYALAQGLVK